MEPKMCYRITKTIPEHEGDLTYEPRFIKVSRENYRKRKFSVKSKIVEFFYILEEFLHIT